MPTIKDVAHLANVSTATVSRVINNSQSVSQETLLQVKQAIKKLKYIPNANARQLVKDDKLTVGLVLTQLSDPFYATIVHEIEQYARHLNISVLISIGSHNATKETEAIRRLQADGCNAIIIYSVALSDQQLLDLSQEIKGLVILNRHISKIASRCLDFNNHAGAELAANYLFDLGHRNIAVVSATNKQRDAKNRLAGIKKAFSDHAVPFNDKDVVYGECDFWGGRLCAETLTARNQEFTAVLCFNDAMAVGIIAQLKQQGLQIPQDVSVIGFDDLFIGKKNSPPLTTIRYPIAIMAQKSIQLAWNIIAEQGKNTPQGYRYFPTLKVRGSTAALRKQ